MRETPICVEEMAVARETFFVKTHELPSDDFPAIYLVRDGRDSLVSYAHYSHDFEQNSAGNSPPTTLQTLILDKGYFGGWGSHVLAWTQRQSPTIVIKFEELVTTSNPACLMKQTLQKMGYQLPEQTTTNRPPIFAEFHKKFPQFFRQGQIGNWRTMMSPELHNLFWQQHGEAMHKMGYNKLGSRCMNTISRKNYSHYWESDDYTKTPRIIRAFNFHLTTYCNLQCPECAANNPRIRYPEHYDLDYIRYVADCLFGLEHVSISGGEATLHPQFRQIIPHLKDWFGCQNLILETNGCKIIEYEDMLPYFDEILISRYPHNQNEVAFLATYDKDNRIPGPTLHATTARRAKYQSPCPRANFILCVYGRLYPCACVPSGYEGIGIPLTKNWREEILNVPLPCTDCCFAEENEQYSELTNGADKGEKTCTERNRSIRSFCPSDVVANVPSKGIDLMRPAWRWPHPRDKIKMCGLDLDSWMGREAEIEVNPAQGMNRLLIHFESHAPPEQHPLTLTFEDKSGEQIATHVVERPGVSIAQLKLRHFLTHPTDSLIRVRCNKDFISEKGVVENSIIRNLCIRVRSLRYAPPHNKENKQPLYDEHIRLIGQYTRELAVKEDIIQTQHSDLTTKDEMIQTQQSELAARDEMIQTQQSELAARDEMIQTQQSELAARDEMIQTQQSELAARDEMIQLQKGKLVEKEDVIQTQHKELIAKEEVIQMLAPFRYTSLHYWLVFRLLHPLQGIILHSLQRYNLRCQLQRLKSVILPMLKKIAAQYLPRAGQLYHYPPIPLQLPKRYYQSDQLVAAPAISIVTPSFNQAAFLEQTLQSVLNQAYPNLEYIIQDGNSTDDTHLILEQYHSQLTHAESHRDKGQTHAINLGFARSTGQIMAWLNSDDLLLPGALNYVANFFAQYPEVDVVYGHRVLIDENGQEIGRWVLPPHNEQILLWADYVPQETLFWRRRIWEKAGGNVDENYQFALDWDLLLRFQTAGAKMIRLPRFLGAFRVHETQKTSNQITDLGAMEMTRLRERYHNRPVAPQEIRRHIAPYLTLSRVYHALYRLGVLWY